MLLSEDPRHVARLERVFEYHATEKCGDIADVVPGVTRKQTANASFDGRLEREIRELNLPEAALHVLVAAPLAYTAWADSNLSSSRRQLALQAIQLQGVRQSSSLWDTLFLWLDRRPDNHLMQVWGDYIGALSWVLSASAFVDLREMTRRRCRAVLRATTGCVGTGRFLTGDHPVLKRIDHVFDGTFPTV